MSFKFHASKIQKYTNPAKEVRNDPTAFLRKYYKLIGKSRDGRHVLFYLASWLQKPEREEFIREVGILTPKDKEYIMRGLQEIRQEGRQEERQALARKMRTKGMDFVTIRELTGIKAKDLEGN